MTEQNVVETATGVKNSGASFDQLKAIGALAISATAKYIGTIMVATGARSVADVCAITGLPKSTVYRAQKEFAEHASDLILTIPTVLTSEIPTIPTDEKITEKTVSLVSPVRISEPEPSCARDITTRATKELPSEVSYLNLDSPLIGPPTPAKTTSKRGTRLSPDWELPSDLLQWTLINFVHANEAMVRTEADQFRDFWIAKTGASATKLDWTATWRNWCRNSRTLARAANPKPFNTGRMAYDEKKASEIANLREYMARRARGEEVPLQ